jgi:hypothetical protein
LKTLEHHDPKRGAIESDDEGLYNLQGDLLDKVGFQYQRDSRDNWTQRIISAWDARAGAMVPIEEDDRTITYY